MVKHTLTLRLAKKLPNVLRKRKRKVKRNNGGSIIESVEANSHHVRSSLRGTHETTSWNGGVVLEYYNDCKTKVSWC